MPTAAIRCQFRLAAAVCLALPLAGCDKQGQPSPPAGESVAGAPAPAITVHPAFEKLKGRWQRTDGGYLLEIRSVRPGGMMEATYANPQPIRVSKAEASQDGERTKVFIELRDVNYPGCTYALTYNATTDQLAGVYYQASLKQQFEVVFTRAN